MGFGMETNILIITMVVNGLCGSCASGEHAIFARVSYIDVYQDYVICTKLVQHDKRLRTLDRLGATLVKWVLPYEACARLFAWISPDTLADLNFNPLYNLILHGSQGDGSVPTETLWNRSEPGGVRLQL